MKKIRLKEKESEEIEEESDNWAGIPIK